MIKPPSLRAALGAALPEVITNPDKLLVFIDEGNLIAGTNAAGSLSFEYGYTLNVILTDCSAEPDTIMLVLVSWVGVNQRNLLDDWQTRKDGIAFEVDLIDNDRYDISIKLRLSEAVAVRTDAEGNTTLTHLPEPQPESALTAGHWRLYLRNLHENAEQLIAEWDVPPR